MSSLLQHLDEVVRKAKRALVFDRRVTQEDMTQVAGRTILFIEGEAMAFSTCGCRQSCHHILRHDGAEKAAFEAKKEEWTKLIRKDFQRIPGYIGEDRP